MNAIIESLRMQEIVVEGMTVRVYHQPGLVQMVPLDIGEAFLEQSPEPVFVAVCGDHRGAAATGHTAEQAARAAYNAWRAR